MNSLRGGIQIELTPLLPIRKFVWHGIFSICSSKIFLIISRFFLFFFHYFITATGPCTKSVLVYTWLPNCFFPDILAGRAGPDRVVLLLRRLLPWREAGAGAGLRDGALRAGDAGGGRGRGRGRGDAQERISRRVL